MNPILIDGKSIAEKIINRVKKAIAKMPKPPKLAFIMVGNNPASEIYVAKKIAACKLCGINAKKIHLSYGCDQKKIAESIISLNLNPNVDAIMLQLPLPSYLEPEGLINKIDPLKDVECLTYANFGKALFKEFNEKEIYPVTALAVYEVLKYLKEDIRGKNIVVIGKSNIAGKPTAELLLKLGATVTVCHSQTKNLSTYTKKAEIIVSAVGKRNLITARSIKNGAIIIDVGIERIGEKIYGDVEFNKALKKVKAITPVPGGVGPITVAKLMENVLKIYKKRQNTNS